MVGAVTLLFLGVCTISDLRNRQIWWPLTVLFILGNFLFHLFHGDMRLVNLAAGILIGGLFMAISWVTKEAIGYGDGLVISGCGAALGFWTALQLLFLAFIFAAVWSAILLVRKRAGRKDSFPFVPFLLAAHLCMMAMP